MTDYEEPQGWYNNETGQWDKPQPDMPAFEKMLKVADVAKMFNVQPATVRDWLKDGTLRGIKIGGGHYWRIPESAATELANRKYGEDA